MAVDQKCDNIFNIMCPILSFLESDDGCDFSSLNLNINFCSKKLCRLKWVFIQPNRGQINFTNENFKNFGCKQNLQKSS